MKNIKTKKIQLIVIGLLFVSQLFSAPSSIKERTENWLKSSSKTEQQGGNRTGGENVETYGVNDPAVPLGEGLALLLGMAGVYVFRVRRNKKD